LVLTAPGVLNVVDDDVEVRLIGATDDTPLVLAMARESDVLAWVGDAPHWEITGLADWETLSYTDSRDPAGADASGSASPTAEGTETESSGDPSGSSGPEESTEPEETTSSESSDDPTEQATSEAETEPVPDPSGSDLWVEQ